MKALNDLTTFKIEDYISMDKLTQYAQGVISFASGIFDIFVAFIVSVYLFSFISHFSKILQWQENRGCKLSHSHKPLSTEAQ